MLYIVAGRDFIKVEINIIYFNYTIALLMAVGSLVVGIESVLQVTTLCIMGGVCFHYFWLSVFSWSLCDVLFILYRLWFSELNYQS